MNHFNDINRQKNKQKKQIINDEYKISKDLQQQQQPFNNDETFVSLLTDDFAIMCQKGHGINVAQSKNVQNHKCIQCGARNHGYDKNHKIPNKEQIKTFLNAYDITKIP
eukprot:60603_1